MGQIQSIDELLDMLWRRRWVIGIIGLIGIVISGYVGIGKPSYYQAVASIQVARPVVTDAPAGSGGGPMSQSLQLIEQRLTTRENLLAVAQRQGLFADVPLMPDDQKVKILRASVQMRSVESAAARYGAGDIVSALIVQVEMEDAEQAARVANDFAQSVLDAGTEGRAAETRATMQFFIEEEARIGAELRALEATIAEFRNRNSDALPGSPDTRREEVVSLDTEIRALDQTLVGLAGERAALEANTRRRAVEDRQLEALLAQFGVLEAQRAALTDRRALVIASIARTPEVERELNSYTRRLDQVQDQHRVITARLAEAETNQRLQERNQAERFTLLERAVIPAEPAGGGGKKIAVLGSVASLVLGFAVAMGIEVMNPVLRNRVQMERMLDLRPVVSIPEVTVAPRRRREMIDKAQRRLESLPKPVLIGGGVLLFVMVMAASAMA